MRRDARQQVHTRLIKFDCKSDKLQFLLLFLLLFYITILINLSIYIIFNNYFIIAVIIIVYYFLLSLFILLLCYITNLLGNLLLIELWIYYWFSC